MEKKKKRKRRQIGDTGEGGWGFVGGRADEPVLNGVRYDNESRKLISLILYSSSCAVCWKNTNCISNNFTPFHPLANRADNGSSSYGNTLFITSPTLECISVDTFALFISSYSPFNEESKAQIGSSSPVTLT